MIASESPHLVGIDARYLRLVCQGSPFPKDAVFNEPLSKMSLFAPSLAYPLTAPLVGLRHVYLPPYSRPFPYDAVGRCIYCDSAKYDDSDSRNLGEEHIIPDGLGANMILPRASCRKHEKLTSRIETKVLHAMFDPLRKQHDIRNRSKKPLLKGNFDVSHMVNGENVTLRLPIADHPTILVLHRLGAPGILSGRPKWLHGIIGWWLVNINADAASLRKHGLSSFASPPIDTVLFSMMLAKIAHAFACAEVRIENFNPLLLEFLLNPSEETEVDNRRYHFVGGDPGIESPSTYLHEIGIGTYELASDMYLVVRIRLFAYLGAPAYFVVVGTVPSTKRATVVTRLSANNLQT